LRHQFSFNSSSVKPLFRFGSWMTVTNVVGPMMVTFDRFAIGAMISVAAVAYYAIPAEVVTKILLLPAALIGVLFPAFSTAHAANRERLVFLFEAGVKYIFAALFPIIVLVVAFAPEGLRYWLGSDFAQHSTLVVRLIAIAVFVNGVGQVPFAHLQSAGRPAITARIHLIELPAYVVVLLLFVKLWGIQGAAIAWMLRIVIDAFLMFVFSHRLSLDSKFMVSKLPLLSLGALVVFMVASLQMGIAVKIIFAGLACSAFIFVAWHWVLSPRERDLLASRFRENHASS
jgi:O-antigen/teichoic acid export membrane protein